MDIKPIAKLLMVKTQAKALSVSTVGRLLERMVFSQKTDSCGALERETSG